MCPWAPGRLEIVTHCLLLETDRAGLVLVDTGLGTADLERGGRRLPALFRALVGPRLDPGETAVARVRALGLDPRDVRHIAITHLDVDHAGGLTDFPWATVHLHERERAAAVHPRGLADRRRYLPAQLAGVSFRGYREGAGGDDWLGLRAIRPLDGLGDEVALVPLVGHSRGHSGVAVRRADGVWLLHAGDAYFHHTELDRPRRCPPGLDLFQRTVAMDERARRRNQSRLRDLRATRPDDVAIFSAHDPAELLPYAGS